MITFYRLLLSGLLLGGIASAEEIQSSAPISSMREIAPGVFELGKMKIDKNAKSVSFPGTLNMATGDLEYVIVTKEGSAHESLLVSGVAPGDIHFAMLLLGAKGAGLMTPAPGDQPPAQIDKDYLGHAPKLAGDPITITAKWKNAAGKEESAPIEDWILNESTHKPATRGTWIYTGSMFSGDVFLAQRDGSIVALVTNPGALINNPRKGNDDDSIWKVNAGAVPPVETPLEITIRIESAPSSPEPKIP